MLLIKKEFVASDFHFIPDNCFSSFKSLFTSARFPYDGAIVPVVSNNVQIIGTIIWKHYPDDRKRPGRLSTTSIALKYQVYISLRSSHDWQGEKYKWVYLACPTRLTLHPSLRPTPTGGKARERVFRPVSREGVRRRDGGHFRLPPPHASLSRFRGRVGEWGVVKSALV